jgi:hypothetical protein
LIFSYSGRNIGLIRGGSIFGILSTSGSIVHCGAGAVFSLYNRRKSRSDQLQPGGPSNNSAADSTSGRRYIDSATCKCTHICEWPSHTSSHNYGFRGGFNDIDFYIHLPARVSNHNT